MLRWLTPDYRVSAVSDLAPDVLRGWGIEAVLLDADGTLKRYRSKDVEPEAAVWLAELHAAGIGAGLISNGIGRRIEPLAASLGLPYVARALKPLPRGCRLALHKMAFSPAKTAIVGDQIFADILAGRLAGLKTILVTPIHPEEEPWFTRLKRPPERWILRRLERQVPSPSGRGLG